MIRVIAGGRVEVLISILVKAEHLVSGFMTTDRCASAIAHMSRGLDNVGTPNLGVVRASSTFTCHARHLLWVRMELVTI